MQDFERLLAARTLNEDVRQGVVYDRIKDSQNKTLPRPSNMYKLSWDCALEDLAHELVKDCNDKSKSDPNHAITFRHYGQSAKPDQINEPLTQAIEEWKAQISAAQWPDDQKYKQGLNIKEFANMIHSKAAAVGCARAKCVFKSTAACFFDVPELKDGEIIYEKGQPCTGDDQCTTYQPSTCEKTSNLCIKGDPQSTPAASTPSGTTSDKTSPAINQICPTNWGVNDKIRNQSLEGHNFRRSELALGRIQKRNGNYYQSARNMIKLVGQHWTSSQTKPQRSSLIAFVEVQLSTRNICEGSCSEM
ncbi:SCP-like protein [Ancylostoma ceylanicum]|uniref:SCP-like protein n=1 Tax=Ancylostoma ceylanicum TaxID=53326 RepID=A0A0D6LK87_9BILA|nr:SCP-like protein [Ancylostoma ceylanicum]